MTSTSFNVGLSDEPRSSSRVLRPPGGGHTDIFGGEPEQPRGRRLLHGAPDQIGEPRKPTNGSEAPQNGGDAHEAAPAPAPDAPTPAEAKADSPAKAEPAKQAAVIPEPAKAEAPKRVRVPPGGFSSGLW